MKNQLLERRRFREGMKIALLRWQLMRATHAPIGSFKDLSLEELKFIMSHLAPPSFVSIKQDVKKKGDK